MPMSPVSLLKRTISVLESFAPLSLAESWDNVGLLVEAPSGIVSKPDASESHCKNKVVVTNDLTPAVLDQCVADPSVGLIVSYHPPLFRPLKRLLLSDFKQRAILECVSAGISVYSPHTALDSCPNGVNDWLVTIMGFSGNVQAIQPTSKEALDAATRELLEKRCGNEFVVGQGRMMKLGSPVKLSDILANVKKGLGLNHVRLALPPLQTQEMQIGSVAVCAGSGASLLMGVDADLYLTGEMSHHEVLSCVAQNKAVILCEHSNTERGYLKTIFKKHLQESLPDVKVEFAHSDEDPLKIV